MNKGVTEREREKARERAHEDWEIFRSRRVVFSHRSRFFFLS
jgi:hypothetical protein